MNLNWDAGDGWSHSHYIQIVKKYKFFDYSVGSFRDYLADQNKKKFLILRHDVDFNFDAAFALAKIENKHEINASYFFRLAAVGYNLLSVPNILKLKDMLQMGHEVSLHVDHGLEKLHSTSQNCIMSQILTFQNFTNIKVNGVSSHEPARNFGTGQLDELISKGVINYHAYESRFVIEMKYLSDSTKRWREKSFEHYIGEHDKLQVLIHPIWWYEKFPQESY